LGIAIQDHLPLPEELQANDLIIDALLGVGIRERAATNAGLDHKQTRAH
jgi:NAD(P)H-hydrate repair Nnr-like enzyme with NAD(P)H-hydrate epimerase domain